MEAIKHGLYMFYMHANFSYFDNWSYVLGLMYLFLNIVWKYICQVYHWIKLGFMFFRKYLLSFTL